MVVSSLAKNSGARMLADVSVLALGAIAAVITARWLGPSGKGIAAALALLAMLFARASALGLGEGGIVMVGQRRVTTPAALRANLAAIGVSSALAAGMFIPVAILQIQPESTALWLAVVVTAIAIPLGAVHDILSQGLNMQERIVESSLVVGLTSVGTITGVALFVIVLSLGVLGAALGTVTGVGVGVLSAALLLSPRFRLKPHWNVAYLRRAVRYGVRVEASYLIAILAGRLDLLLVFSLAGQAAAGNYSVALTIAGVAGLAPWAFSYAAFPQLAYIEESGVKSLSLLIWRRGLIASAAVAALLGVLGPVFISPTFGDAFQPAVVPTVILLGGAVCVSGQLVLARAVAARGDPRLILRSFGLSLIVMIALDLVLIPALGITGAAIASTVSNCGGLGMCVRHYRRAGVGLSELVPRWSDCVGLARTARSLVGSLGHSWSAQPTAPK